MMQSNRRNFCMGLSAVGLPTLPAFGNEAFSIKKEYEKSYEYYKLLCNTFDYTGPYYGPWTILFKALATRNYTEGHKWFNYIDSKTFEHRTMRINWQGSQALASTIRRPWDGLLQPSLDEYHFEKWDGEGACPSSIYTKIIYTFNKQGGIIHAPEWVRWNGIWEKNSYST